MIQMVVSYQPVIRRSLTPYPMMLLEGLLRSLTQGAIPYDINMTRQETEQGLPTLMAEASLTAMILRIGYQP